MEDPRSDCLELRANDQIQKGDFGKPEMPRLLASTDEADSTNEELGLNAKESFTFYFFKRNRTDRYLLASNPYYS